jgi:hypothetical protein
LKAIRLLALAEAFLHGRGEDCLASEHATPAAGYAIVPDPQTMIVVWPKMRA